MIRILSENMYGPAPYPSLILVLNLENPFLGALIHRCGAFFRSQLSEYYTGIQLAVALNQ
jgi:hypothetical protein